MAQQSPQRRLSRRGVVRFAHFILLAMLSQAVSASEPGASVGWPSTEGAPGGGDDETDSIVGGVSYALGPGITASGSILYGKFENESDGTVNSGSEGKSTMGIVGIAVKF